MSNKQNDELIDSIIEASRIAELEAAIVERDSIIARFSKVMTQQAKYIEELREGQSATASLERWKDEQPTER